MNVAISIKKAPKGKRPHWIAERRLERLDVKGGVVILRMGCPEPDPDCPRNRDWRCPYAITGLGDDAIHFAHGVESMDTLMNTFRGFRARVLRSAIPLQWEMMAGDNIGLSKYVEDGFGFGFEQRMQRMVLSEVENLCNEPHDCLADAGLRVALLEEKYGKHRLIESTQRMLAEAQKQSQSGSEANNPRRIRWIASRNLLRFEHENRRVVVRIGRPEMMPTTMVWRCPFEVRGLPEATKEFGFGIDSMHAIQMALDGIRRVLVTSDIDLNWEGIRAADPGFPMTIPAGFGRGFEQRLEKMIADKVEERIRPIRKRHEQREAQRTARKKPITK